MDNPKQLITRLCRSTIVLLALACVGNPTIIDAGPARALAAPIRDEGGSVHRPLATLGVTTGQTVRINLVNSPDPASPEPPTRLTVELCFHDANGNLILDRWKRPIQKTATVDPHQGEFLDLNGNLVAAPGSRVVIIPCVRMA